MSRVIAVIGAKGTGKSTFIKERIKNVHEKALYVYDKNKEYDRGIRQILDIEQFKDLVLRLRNSVIVFEEAALFFNAKGHDKKMLEILGLARHTNNTVFLAFYSFRSLPPYIYDLVNTLVIHKTKDTIKSIDRKYEDEDLNRIYAKVKSHNNVHYHIIYEAHELILKKT